MEHTFDSGRTPARFAIPAGRRRSDTAAPVFDVLEKDQRHILRLFAAIEHFAEGDDERLDLFEQLRCELLAHLHAEENATYPYLAAVGGVCMAQSSEEHRGFEAAIGRLERTPMGEGWRNQFAELQAGLLAHMQRERKSLLPRVKLETPIEEQLVLGRVFEALRDRHLEERGPR